VNNVEPTYCAEGMEGILRTLEGARIVPFTGFPSAFHCASGTLPSPASPILDPKLCRHTILVAVTH
jgi:hypothetical protein